MPIVFSTKIEGVEPLLARLERHPKKVVQLIETNFIALGGRLSYVMRQALKPVKYTGETERSVSSDIDVANLTLTVGPTAKQAIFIRTGTRPGWRPIEPLKRWAYWKLGDEQVGYKVRWSIKRFGTSRWLAIKGVRGAEQTEYGIGLNFPRVAMEDGRAQVAITNTARRIGLDLSAYLKGEND